VRSTVVTGGSTVVVVLHEAVLEATQLGHSWVGDEHFLLALLATRSVASEVLEELGVTRGRITTSLERRAEYQAQFPEAERADAGISPTPAAYGLMGRADGFAASDGARHPRPEHWLLAMMWTTSSAVSTLHHLGASQTAVIEGLRERGVHVPEIDPPLYRPWRRGQTVEVEHDELQPLLDVLRHLYPPGSDLRWGFNWLPDEAQRRARVDAESGIDLDAALAEART
jgi:ATP-dependent Clp protease ATP-binding subunit ClpA